jgi:hypothetical protein
MKEAFCVERERKPKSASSLSSTQIPDRLGWVTAGSSRCDEPPRSGAQPPPRAVAAAETAPDPAPARGRSTVRNDGACRRRPLGSPRALSSSPPGADDDISLYAPQIWKAVGQGSSRGGSPALRGGSAADGARRACGEERPERRGVGRLIRGHCRSGGGGEAGRDLPNSAPMRGWRTSARLRRRRGVEDEDAAMEVHDQRELFEVAAAGDLRGEEAGAQVVGDGAEPPRGKVGPQRRAAGTARRVRGNAQPARSGPTRRGGRRSVGRPYGLLVCVGCWKRKILGP